MKRDRTSPFENRTSGTNVSANGTGDESRLRKRVRAAVDAGRLPDRRPDRMWGGPGAGAICPICEGLVDHNETEIEVEFDPPDEVGFHVHVHCFAAWEIELRNRELARVRIDAEQAERALAAPVSVSAGHYATSSPTNMRSLTLMDPPSDGKLSACGSDAEYNRGPE